MKQIVIQAEAGEGKIFLKDVGSYDVYCGILNDQNKRGMIILDIDINQFRVVWDGTTFNDQKSFKDLFELLNSLRARVFVFNKYDTLCRWVAGMHETYQEIIPDSTAGTVKDVSLDKWYGMETSRGRRGFVVAVMGHWYPVWGGAIVAHGKTDTLEDQLVARLKAPHEVKVFEFDSYNEFIKWLAEGRED